MFEQGLLLLLLLPGAQKYRCNKESVPPIASNNLGKWEVEQITLV